MAAKRPPERRAAAQIVVTAVRAVSVDHRDGAFGERLALVEAGGLLGEVGEALSEGPDQVAELRLSRLLRIAAPVRTAELQGIVRDLATVTEEPWPEISEALAGLVSEAAS